MQVNEVQKLTYLWVSSLGENAAHSVIVACQAVHLHLSAHIPNPTYTVATPCHQDVQGRVQLEGIDSTQVPMVVANHLSNLITVRPKRLKTSCFIHHQKRLKARQGKPRASRQAYLTSRQSQSTRAIQPQPEGRRTLLYSRSQHFTILSSAQLNM